MNKKEQYAETLKALRLQNDFMKEQNTPPLEVLPPEDYSKASFVFSHLRTEIENFEKTLDDTHEISFQLTCFGLSMVMSVTSIGYQNPNLLYFYGTINGQKAQLVQHVNQLNFLILSTKIEDESRPPRRIGFNLPGNAAEAP